MTVKGQTKVNVGHIIRVIMPYQYRIPIQVASLIELVANSLDAKPSIIEINFEPKKGVLEVMDDGGGMGRHSFVEYHDVTPAKIRGTGIGFAGQGAKLALNFCDKVVTETWSSSYKGSSIWRLEEDDAPYQIEHKVSTLNHQGTKVVLHLDDRNKGFYSQSLIEEILNEHYFPLLDERLLRVYKGEKPILVDERRSSLKIYKPIYSKGVKFIINGKQIKEDIQSKLEKQKEITIGVQRKPKTVGFFGLAKDSFPEDLSGVAISTFGKVIERTFFRKEPSQKQRIFGWIEAPYLIEAVTTDKCGFQRGDKTWEAFFRKAQAKFANWLEETGLVEKPVKPEADFSNLEREINFILRNLPELDFFVVKTSRDLAIPDEMGQERKLGEGTQKVGGTKGGETKGEGVSVHPGDEPGQAPTLELGKGKAATPQPRTIRSGIGISRQERADLEKEAWFDGQTVVINEAHPAYKRAANERLLNYHVVKCVCLGLVESCLERASEPSCQKVFELSQKFFRLWGER